MSVEQRLYEWIGGIQYDRLPPAVRERAAVIWMHDLVLGRRFGHGFWPGQVLQDGLQTKAPDQGWLLLGQTKRSYSAEESVQFNSTSMASSVLEDFYGGLHLGPVIIPVVMHELEKSDGLADSKAWEKAVEAVVAGFETGIWLQDRFGELLGQMGLRATPLIGALAAVGAIAKMRGLSEAEYRAALSLPASIGLGAGFSLLGGTEEWIYQAGLSARLAYQSVRFTRGMRYPNASSLTGSHSLRKLLKDGHVAGHMGDALQNNRYRILDVGLKRHPVNIFVQPAVEAMSRTVREIGKDAVRGATEIEIQVAEQVSNMKLLQHPGPFEQPYQSVLSIPACVAMAGIHGSFLFADLRQINQFEIQKTARKVNITGSRELSAYDARLTMKSKGQVVHQAGVQSDFFYPPLDRERQWLETKGWNITGDDELWISPILKLLTAGR
ncbi:MmgE/PrpD family protein [Ferviditalea candida]|uniref:MmgE/PrpD family protein n=1 Tax=Ferviditalea candida TaxID=3108399 RepID=A0ABU5ZFG5_9BACL|nr:MmgE/PrpD family protein [Paenibacillaceae bacterium T2]